MTGFDSIDSAGTWTPRRRDDVVSQPPRGETLLYDPFADAVHVLNATALAVWELRARFIGIEDRDLARGVPEVLSRFKGEGLFI